MCYFRSDNETSNSLLLHTLGYVRDGDWATTQPTNHHHPSSANHAKEQQSIELARGPKSEFGVKDSTMSDPAASVDSPPEEPAPPPPNPGPDAAGPSTMNQDGRFECNICLDTAKDAVISMCGHLFCWPCLYQWLETRPTRQTCPVCKSAISKEKVIPLYGRGGDQTDPRNKAPPRPAGQRSEPTTNFRRFNWGGADDGMGGGLQFSFGIGAFPFTTIFGTTLSFGERRPDAPHPGTREYEEEQFISKVFLWIAVIFIMWLLMA